MKRIAFKPLYLVAFLIAGFSMSRSASADVCGHLRSLALKIDRQASRLLSETRHYRHTPNYGRMVAEVAVLRAKARHMRVTTFTTANFHHLEEDLRMVDRCFHKVEAFFDAAEIAAANGVGHIHGSTRHVKCLLEDLDETICAMRTDVRALRREVFASRRGRTIIQESHYIAPTTYRSTRTIYGGSPSIRFGGRDDCGRGRGQDFRRVYDPYGGGAFQIQGKNLSFRIRF